MLFLHEKLNNTHIEVIFYTLGFPVSVVHPKWEFIQQTSIEPWRNTNSVPKNEFSFSESVFKEQI